MCAETACNPMLEWLHLDDCLQVGEAREVGPQQLPRVRALRSDQQLCSVQLSRQARLHGRVLRE